VSFFLSSLGPKRLELLRELVPTAAVIAVLFNPTNPVTESDTKDMQAAADTVGQQIRILGASSEHDLDAAFVTLVQQHADALLVNNDALFSGRHNQIVALAAHHALQSIICEISLRQVAWLAMGPMYRRAIARLASTPPASSRARSLADLPVMQPTKFELVINLKTAKALGLTIPGVVSAARQ
jgi:putative ABC transport system substrate-binding protein